MATYTTPKLSTNDIYVVEPREIVDILGPGEYLLQNGQPSERYTLVLAGPKGGKFHLSLPDWWADIAVQDIVIGDGFSGGWRAEKFEGTIWSPDVDC